MQNLGNKQPTTSYPLHTIELRNKQPATWNRHPQWHIDGACSGWCAAKITFRCALAECKNTCAFRTPPAVVRSLITRVYFRIFYFPRYYFVWGVFFFSPLIKIHTAAMMMRARTIHHTQRPKIPLTPRHLVKVIVEHHHLLPSVHIPPVV